MLTPSLDFLVRADTLVRLALVRSTVELPGVEVSAEGIHRIGETWLTPREVNQIPAIAGEVDLVKAVQLLPGVSGGREGEAGLYVRGGSPNQTLVLLDGTPVYNVNHMLGFLSVFNPDVVRSVKLIKGAGSARYGGRLSSVLDVAMKEGNLNERRTSANVGLVASRVTTEGPIRRGRAAYLFSVRRTYLDAIYRLFQSSKDRSGFHFYDLVGKVSMVGRRQGLYLSLYGGQDLLSQRYKGRGVIYNEQYQGEMYWGNHTGSLRWQSQLTPTLLASIAVSRTSYRLALDEQRVWRHLSSVTEDEATTFRAGVADWSARLDIELQAGKAHRFLVGGNAIRHKYTPSMGHITRHDKIADIRSVRIVGSASPIRSWEAAAYVEDEVSLGQWTHANLGLRGSAVIVEETSYSALEPRLALRHKIRAHTTLELSYAEARQYAHFISRSGIGVPIDLWLPATSSVGPQQDRQLTAGVRRTFFDSVLQVSSDVYLRNMKGLVTSIEGSYLLGIEAAGWEQRVYVGEGTAYGLEVLVRKREGRLTGWMAYTLARSIRRFEEIDNGESFPHRFDRRHDLAVTSSFQLNTRWALSGTWVFATGDAVWIPVARTVDIEDFGGYGGAHSFDEAGPYSLVLGARNGSRTPLYHRLDLAARYKKRGHTVTFGFYNIYAHRNSFFLYGELSTDGRIRYRKVSPFILIPAISYGISF